jgi:Na+/melibiose symporter-like transporter
MTESIAAFYDSQVVLSLCFTLLSFLFFLFLFIFMFFHPLEDPTAAAIGDKGGMGTDREGGSALVD